MPMKHQKRDAGGRQKGRVGRGEQLQGKWEGRVEEVMEQKPIKLQSRGQDRQQRKRNTPQNTQRMVQPAEESST